MKYLKQYWGIILAVILTIILIGTTNKSAKFSGLLLSGGNKVAQGAIQYINDNLLQSGQTATLGEVKNVSGVYKFKLTIGGSEYESYVTKDGKILFTSGIEMVAATGTKESTTTTTVSKQSCEDLTKVDQPIIEAFVVSKCPFGLQMQRILAEIVKNIPEVAQYIKVEYMGAVNNGKVSSMHGDEEAQENLRQVCIREEQPNKYWDYITCHIKKGDVDSCSTIANIDKNILATCLNDVNKSIAYIQKDFENQDKYNDTPECKQDPTKCAVGGSPALILNGKAVSEFDFGGRTAEALKTVICCGFKTQPSFCSQKLTTNQAATSFSENYSSGGSSSAASCN